MFKWSLVTILWLPQTYKSMLVTFVTVLVTVLSPDTVNKFQQCMEPNTLAMMTGDHDPRFLEEDLRKFKIQWQI